MDGELYDDERELSLHMGVIEDLAREWDLPASEVSQLYETELARLKAQARVRDFLPLLASHAVRDALRSR